MNDQAIIEQAIARIRGEFGSDLLGLIVGGSRLRSEGDPQSDLDFVVVIARPQRKRWNFSIEGVDVETLINPPFQMRRYFEEERMDGRGLMPHLCSTGHIVFDPEGLMAALQAEASSIWNAGPPPLSVRENWQFRYHAADALRDLADVETSDPERAAFLVGLILPKLINQHYRISGRWLAKPNRVFNDLAIWDAAAANLARKACSDGATTGERCAAVRRLADHVLAPLGGIMPTEWSTDWEFLVPAVATLIEQYDLWQRSDQCLGQESPRQLTPPRCARAPVAH
ncbi:MAG TPA: nucleotidyltransferase domain-containing protein [Xanthobacteraceae bacterium]|jgi:predicted nucleotidyltransferase